MQFKPVVFKGQLYILASIQGQVTFLPASKQILSLLAQCWHRCRLSHKPETRSCPLLLSLTSTFRPMFLSSLTSHFLHLWPGATVYPSHCSSNRSTGQTEGRALLPKVLHPWLCWLKISLNHPVQVSQLQSCSSTTSHLCTFSHPCLHLALSLLISQASTQACEPWPPLTTSLTEVLSW